MPPSVNSSEAARGSLRRAEPGTANECEALAHSNIALAKYWGKRDRELNLPDVPSLSMTLEALCTRTRVRFEADLTSDQFTLNGKPPDAAASTKVTALLNRVRQASGLKDRARVESENDFPTASGLASSASGFAALALASTRAAGLDWSERQLSRLARESSVSAARSIFGGFVSIEAGAEFAERLEASERAPALVMVIAVTDPGPKPVGSTSAMLQTQASSPYYSSFRSSAPAVYREVRDALLAGDLQRLGEAMEHSTLLMHACMLAARPPLWYWNVATLAALDRVRQLRRAGTLAYFTIDAGPHVKVLTQQEDSEHVRRELASVPGVQRVIVSGIGTGARVVEAP